jgi:hypothetical protein
LLTHKWNAPKHASSLWPSALVTFCWFEETASTLIPLIAVLNLRREKEKKRKKEKEKKESGGQGLWDNMGFLLSSKTQWQAPMKAPVHFRAEDTKPHLAETRV